MVKEEKCYLNAPSFDQQFFYLLSTHLTRALQ